VWKTCLAKATGSSATLPTNSIPEATKLQACIMTGAQQYVLFLAAADTGSAAALLLGELRALLPMAARRGCCCFGSLMMGVGFVPGLSRSIKHSHLHLTAHALPPPPLASNLQALTSSVLTHAAGKSAECGISVLRCAARDVMTWSIPAPQAVKLQRAADTLTAPSALTPQGSRATSQLSSATLHIT
jgi:hypothetical protein